MSYGNWLSTICLGTCRTGRQAQILLCWNEAQSTGRGSRFERTATDKLIISMSGTVTEQRYKDKVNDCDVSIAFEALNNLPAPVADNSADASAPL
jgi:hypothetical protein